VADAQGQAIRNRDGLARRKRSPAGGAMLNGQKKRIQGRRARGVARRSRNEKGNRATNQSAREDAPGMVINKISSMEKEGLEKKQG